MIRVENIEVWGFRHAIRGMRNPMNSWERSDSVFNAGFDSESVIVGDNDLELIKRLARAGQPHRKYLRQIFISMDITAPLYWWKEFDTYKVGTVANSCSTMHKIQDKVFTLDDFSHEHLILEWEYLMKCTIASLNMARDMYLETKDKKYWWRMIQLLPSSYNQKRTVTMNYENALSMIEHRANHKLDEWCSFVEILKTLPYIKELIE
ncbi:MAG: hypothetical protein IJ736_15090 [Firmicutes bacterium]|nr:hypothetical protein [Bacillota bacterium]